MSFYCIWHGVWNMSWFCLAWSVKHVLILFGMECETCLDSVWHGVWNMSWFCLAWSVKHVLILFGMECETCLDSVWHGVWNMSWFCLAWSVKHVLILFGMECETCLDSVWHGVWNMSWFCLAWSVKHVLILFGIECETCLDSIWHWGMKSVFELYWGWIVKQHFLILFGVKKRFYVVLHVKCETSCLLSYLAWKLEKCIVREEGMCIFVCLLLYWARRNETCLSVMFGIEMRNRQHWESSHVLRQLLVRNKWFLMCSSAFYQGKCHEGTWLNVCM